MEVLYVDNTANEEEGVNLVAELERKSKEAGRLAYALRQDFNHACTFSRISADSIHATEMTEKVQIT
jgi:hypothetical protein